MTAPVNLRPLREADLPILHRWYQDPRLWESLVGAFTPRAEAEAVAYMRRWLTPTSIEERLGVVLADSHELIGQTFLSPIDAASGTAEFHIMLGPSERRGQGLGQSATEQMLAHAFARGLQRVTLKVLATNMPARRLYERLGFEVISAEVEAVRKNGVMTPVIEMAIDRETFVSHGRSATT